MFPADTKFLVVDDSAMMRKIILDALAELGYQNFEEANDGITAHPALLQAAKDGHPFQVIFSDSNMPKMTGLALLKKCKSDPKLKMIPFLMLTVENERHEIAEAIKFGAAEYIIKPFTIAILKEKLDRVSGG